MIASLPFPQYYVNIKQTKKRKKEDFILFYFFVGWTVDRYVFADGVENLNFIPVCRAGLNYCYSVLDSNYLGQNLSPAAIAS